MTRLFAALFCFALPAISAPSFGAGEEPENFRLEITGSLWRSGVEGSIQSGILPIDLRTDLALRDRQSFFGRLVWQPRLRHKVVAEGSPLLFRGTNNLSRDVDFNGQRYFVRETLGSQTSLTYVFGAYQYDLLNRDSGHFGLQFGAAYLDAEGDLRSARTGVSTARRYRVGVPLIGGEGRLFVLHKVISVGGDIKGITLGHYGRYVQGGGQVGLHWWKFAILAGYAVLDADLHESSSERSVRAGAAPRIAGPIFSIQWRR